MLDIRRGFKAIAVLLLGLLLTGCGDMQQTDQEATAMIDQYFLVQKNGDIEAAVAMFPPELQAQMQLLLTQAVVDRGTVKQYVVESIEPNTVYSGKYYIATVQVTGRKADASFNTSSTEIVTAFRKLSEDRTYIVAHKIKHIH